MYASRDLSPFKRYDYPEYNKEKINYWRPATLPGINLYGENLGELTDDQVKQIVITKYNALPPTTLMKIGLELASGNANTLVNELVRPLMTEICTVGTLDKFQELADKYGYYVGAAILLTVVLTVLFFKYH